VRIIIALNFFDPFSTLSSAHFVIKRSKANIPIKMPQNVPQIMPVPTRCTAGFILILSSGLQMIPKKNNMLFLSDFINDSSPIPKTTYLQVPKRPFFLPPLFSEGCIGSTLASSISSFGSAFVFIRDILSGSISPGSLFLSALKLLSASKACIRSKYKY